jgi:hypothetical protein
MFPTEQVRKVKSELNLVNDPTVYSITSSSWATLHNYGNITLAEDGLLAVHLQLDTNNSNGAFCRVKIGGSLYAWGVKHLYSAGVYTKYGFLVWLAAGTYAILVEGCLSANTLNLKNLQCGFAKLTDSVGLANVTYSNSVALTVAARKTAIGDLKEAVFAINLFGSTPSGQTNFENIGETLTNGVSVTVDAQQVNASERNQDVDSKGNASAKYYVPLTVGVQHTVAVSKRNANTVVNISIIACPWILTVKEQKHRPVTFNFPQGSTLYLTLEPLFVDAGTNVVTGLVRAVSFGDICDYYHVASGTGILADSYTFQTVNFTEVETYVYGLGGCVSIVGVDIRPI